MPSVGITLITHNRLEFTRRCLNALLELTQGPYHLTVVDNHSADGTVEFLTMLHDQGRFDRLVLLDRNYGVAPAGNVGWVLSDADLQVRLDNDILCVRPDWLTRMVEASLAGRDTGLGVLSHDFFAREGRVGERLLLPSGPVVIRPRNGCEVYGGCVMIRRDVFTKLGFWCEDYGQYGWEDSDYGIRAMLAGYTNVFPDTGDGLVHLGEADPGNDPDYFAFKAGKFEALNRAAGEHVMSYLLEIRPLFMRRRYRTEFTDERHAHLIPDPEYRNVEERASRDFTRRLRDAGVPVKFPRTREEAMLMREQWLRLRQD